MKGSKTTYRTLRDDDQFRLLLIQPGEYHEPVSCDLQVACLDTCRSYKTLSYVWGDPYATRSIYLDGCEHWITTNLHIALQRLRSQAKAIAVWIDALCINQSDTIERLQQVSIMAQIYSSCEEVIMWLGLEIEEDTNPRAQELAKTLITLFQRQRTGGLPRNNHNSGNYHVLLAHAIIYILASNKHIHELPCFVEDQGSMWKVSPGFMPALRALHSFMSLPYWSRAWIVQEIILPSSGWVVHGQEQIHWSVLAHAVGNFDIHISDCCKDIFATIPLEERKLFAFFETKVKDIEYIRQRRSTGTRLKLEWLLPHFFSRRATDPRDKVYALLSLVDPAQAELIKPDYDKPAQDLYEELTIHFLNSNRDFNLLVGEGTRNPELPSWIIDWGRVYDPDLWEWDRERQWMYDHYSSGKGQEFYAELVQKSKLKVNAMLVDKIAEVGPLMDSMYLGDVSCMSFEDILYIRNAVCSPLLTSEEREEWMEKYWRTICGDLICKADESDWGITMSRVKADDRLIFERWREEQNLAVEEIFDSTKEKDDIDRFQYSVAGATRNRRFFITDHGYLGLGPSQMQAGDDIYVICGSRVPFVFRRSLEAETNYAIHAQDVKGISSDKTFRLLGDCFVYGFMDGEIFGDGVSRKESLYIE